MNKWYIYVQPIAGLAVGAEILFDSDGKWSFGVQLFLVRILFTRKQISYAQGE